MSAKTWGWAEVALGIILEFVPGAEAFGTSLIIGGLSTEAAIYFAPTPPSNKKAIQGTIMQTDAWAELVYGTARKGGVLAYINSSDTNWERLDMVVAHAITDPAQGIDGFGDFWINDQVLRVRPTGTWSANTLFGDGDAIMVTAADGNKYEQTCYFAGVTGSTEPTWQTDRGAITNDGTVVWQNGGTQESDWTWDGAVCAIGSDGYVRPKSGSSYVHGTVTAGEFAGMIELWGYVGTQTTVDSQLHALYWGDSRIPYPSTAIGKGVVYTHWAFTPSPTNGGKEAFQKAFGGSIPYKLEATIRGEKVLDPRTSTTAYSENPALIVRDYLTRDPMNGGCGIPASAIDDINGTIPSANVCDQQVPMSF